MNHSLGNMLGGAGAINPDKLALNLQFATDKTLRARRGPTPVFTRASTATHVGPTGLIGYAENLAFYSQRFDTNKDISGNIVFEGADLSTAPDGTLTADRIRFTGGTTGSILASTLGSFTGSKVVSLWVKHVPTFDFIGATFRLQFGGAVSSDFTATTQWQRFEFVTTDDANGRCGIIAPSTGSTQTFDIWGIQYQRGTFSTEYLPTTTAAVYGARFDHDPITLACRGLLIEESRTNLCLQSNAFSTTQWGNINTACAVSQNEIGVDGLSNSAWTFTDDSAVNAEGRFTTASLTTGVTYSLSIFVKKTTGTPSTYPAIWLARGGVFGGCVINTTAGTATAITVFGAGTIISTTSSVVDFGNFWRVTSFIPVNATGTWEISISPSGNGTGTGVIDGTTTGSAVFWGAQLEAGAFPTSYIPTTNASVVRSADVCSISGANFTSFYNQPEGTLYLDAAPPFESQLAYPLMVNTTGLAQAHYISRSNEFGAGSKRWRAWTLNVGIEATISTAGNITTTNVKAAYAYKLNDNAFAVNNVLVGTDTVVGMPNPTSMRIGGNDGANALNGHIASIRYFRKRLPNAKLQTLTA